MFYPKKIASILWEKSFPHLFKNRNWLRDQLRDLAYPFTLNIFLATQLEVDKLICILHCLNFFFHAYREFFFCKILWICFNVILIIICKYIFSLFKIIYIIWTCLVGKKLLNYLSKDLIMCIISIMLYFMRYNNYNNFRLPIRFTI